MKSYIKNIVAILIFCFLIDGSSVWASDVETNIKTYVSTGGNTVKNGESVEGSTKTSVSVYTEVNGGVVENFEKEFEGETEFLFESSKDNSNSKVNTEIRVESNVGKDTELLEEEAVSEVLGEEIVMNKAGQEIGFFRKILNYVFEIFKF